MDQAAGDQDSYNLWAARRSRLHQDEIASLPAGDRSAIV